MIPIMHVCGARSRPARTSARVLAACALGACALALGGCSHASAGHPLNVGTAAHLPPSRVQHVVIIAMENASFDEVIGNAAAPYTNALARRYGLATASYAVTHPSLPNYIALTSGSTHGISSDCTECSVSATNIVDQLEAAHLSWRAYLESVPAPCYGGEASGSYAKKHNPFVYYQDIARSRSRCAHLVGFSALAADLRAGRLPAYAWITPNLCDDGHDCGIAVADRFLARTVPALLRELGPDGLLVLTWDEGGGSEGCCGGAGGGRVASILAGPDVIRGARDARPIDTYGILGTIEEALGLPTLAGAADPRSGRLRTLLSSSER